MGLIRMAVRQPLVHNRWVKYRGRKPSRRWPIKRPMSDPNCSKRNSNVRREKLHNLSWFSNNENLQISSKILIRTSANSKITESCKEINIEGDSVLRRSSRWTIYRQKSIRKLLTEIELKLALVRLIVKNGAFAPLTSPISLERQLPKDTRATSQLSHGTNNFMTSPSSTQSTWRMEKYHSVTTASMKGWGRCLFM